MKKLKVIGQSHPIKDAGAKVTGQFQYTADLELPNMLHAKVLFSPVAHADILSIDTSEAELVEGVVAIATAFNTSFKTYNSSTRYIECDLPENEVVFAKTVKFVGDRVAAVAAETIEAAEEAVKLIKVEYKELPAVFDVEEAVKDDAPQVHSTGNKLTTFDSSSGNVEQGFSEADYIFEDKYRTPAVHHGAMEPHTALAHFDFNNKLTVYSPNQNSFQFRILLARIFNLSFSKVRVVVPGIGGSFGGKLEMSVEPVAAALSIMTRRPVKVVYSRKESMISTRTRHASVVTIKTGVKKTGEITAQDVFMLTNTGAYTASGINVMAALHHKVFKVYKTKNMRFRGHPVYTNLPIAGAMRGYGSPQIFGAQQMQFQKIVESLGLDMAEFQKLNAKDKDGVDLRFNSPVGNPRIIDCIEKGMELFDWKNRKREETDEYYRGFGMAIGAHGNGVYGAHRDLINLTLKVNEDGSATLLTGVHEMGNGSETMQSQVIAEELGIDFEKVETLAADTDAVPWNLGDYASRGVFVEGAGAKQIAEKMRDKILSYASEMLDVDVDTLSLENGKVVGDKEEVTIESVATFVQRDKNEELIIVDTYNSPAGRTSYGVHFAEVEVSKKSKKAKVVDYVAVHDVGKVINPIGIEGQLEGGIHMGIGYALSEELLFDENGVLLNADFGKYKMLRATDMPPLKLAFIEDAEFDAPYGGKSIGECATNPSAPAVANAVANAIGKSLYKLPIDTKKVLG